MAEKGTTIRAMAATFVVTETRVASAFRLHGTSPEELANTPDLPGGSSRQGAGTGNSS